MVNSHKKVKYKLLIIYFPQISFSALYSDFWLWNEILKMNDLMFSFIKAIHPPSFIDNFYLLGFLVAIKVLGEKGYFWGEGG